MVAAVGAVVALCRVSLHGEGARLEAPHAVRVTVLSVAAAVLALGLEGLGPLVNVLYGAGNMRSWYLSYSHCTAY